MLQCNFLPCLKNIVVSGFGVKFNFQKFKVALNLLPRLFFTLGEKLNLDMLITIP